MLINKEIAGLILPGEVFRGSLPNEYSRHTKPYLMT